ncbi:helix-turn-helix transcriptional regulator [Coralliovum pocilloporae]|uniref:helix-turn-helix transcriptional regulator n=1 Tax=Coralliovum pocilloporae TaxID=3066369 RepID=UPI003306E973
MADPSLWPDLLQEFANQINAAGCIVFEWQTHALERRLSVSVASSAYDLNAIETYIERLFEDEAHDQDVFEAHSLKSDAIDLIQDDVLATSLEDLKNRKNVQALQKLGILHRAAGLLNKDNSANSRFSLQLDASRGRLSAAEQHYIGLVLPHIAKAFDLGRPSKQLAEEHQGMLAAMDHLIVGVCILDNQSRMVVENEEFRRQRDSYSAFRLNQFGTLQFSSTENQAVFEKLKSDALNHGRFGARPRKEAISAKRDTFLCIEVVPLQRSDEIGTTEFNGYIVYSSDTSKPVNCQVLPVQMAYGLTKTELSIVESIAEGLTNQQIADQRSRSVATINAQVKSILSKTHCSTRTQFVRLLMSFGTNYIARPE